MVWQATLPASGRMARRRSVIRTAALIDQPVVGRLRSPDLAGAGQLVCAEPNHSFRVSASPDAGSLPPLWVAPPLPGSGAVSRRSSLVRLESAVRALHVTPLEGDGWFITTGLRIQRPPLRVPHWILVPILWLGWLLARLAGRGYGAMAKATLVRG